MAEFAASSIDNPENVETYALQHCGKTYCPHASYLKMLDSRSPIKFRPGCLQSGREPVLLLEGCGGLIPSAMSKSHVFWRNLDSTGEQLHKTLAVEPQNMEFFATLVNLYLQSGQVGQAVMLAQKLLQNDPEHPDALEFLDGGPEKYGK